MPFPRIVATRMQRLGQDATRRRWELNTDVFNEGSAVPRIRDQEPLSGTEGLYHDRMHAKERVEIWARHVISCAINVGMNEYHQKLVRDKLATIEVLQVKEISSSSSSISSIPAMNSQAQLCATVTCEYLQFVP